MITIKEGDITQATERVIAHQCNAQGVMGAGVARALNNKFPEIYVPYKELCKSKTSPLGEVSFVSTHGKLIANIIGQEQFGRNKDTVYTNYQALSEGLEKVAEVARHYNYSVALPYKIGCGLANGDWATVQGMIHLIFEDIPVTLYKY